MICHKFGEVFFLFLLIAFNDDRLRVVWIYFLHRDTYMFFLSGGKERQARYKKIANKRKKQQTRREKRYDEVEKITRTRNERCQIVRPSDVIK